eukprot:TRINITY_DN9196_c1_g2_i1.p1 TRINITY_DN9196_c1_g2~~TRINITY_DN9196_c1_g2_i1.p1  ORF type:complete len:166 (+),score=24.38 TRINITY_DN9196_c1_g2_i1:106-603(+)
MSWLGRDEGGSTGWSIERECPQAALLPLDAKMATYERFIEETLKPALERLLTKRDGVYDEQIECAKLRRFISDRASKQGALKTMVDVGKGFYLQARVPDPTRIFINVGLGVHAEMDLEQAAAHLQKREDDLEKQAQVLTQKASAVKVQLKIVLEAMAERSGVAAA